MKTLLLTLTTLLLSINSHAAWTPGRWQTYRAANVDAYVYVPTVHRVRSSALMLSLHGCAQKAEDLMKQGNWEEAAEAYDMVVVLPKVPNGGKIAGCWDYYGADHTETNRDNGPVINLTKSLLADDELAVDQNKVYISGLSAGATEALIVGCLRPDLFSGVAINAGPALGTGMTELHQPPASPDNALRLCQKYAGAHAADFATQIASLIADPKDPMVDFRHDAINALMLAQLYGAGTKTAVDTSTLPGTSTKGSGALWSDSNNQARVFLIANEGLGHNWPAGQSVGRKDTNQNAPAVSPILMPMFFGGGFVSATSVNYPMVLGKFFSENNLRH